MLRWILGISPASGRLKYGLAMGLFAWVALTAGVIVGMFLGLGGNAGSGMKVHGAELEDLMALVSFRVRDGRLGRAGDHADYHHTGDFHGPMIPSCPGWTAIDLDSDGSTGAPCSSGR